MVVAQVVLTLDPGGQEYVVLQLAERLQRRGMRSPVVALAGGALMEEAHRRGVRAFDLGKKAGLDPSLFVRLAGLLRRERVDVVHTHNFAPLIYGTLAARALGLPTLNTRHGRAPLSTHRLIWSLTRRAVAVSEDARRELVRHNRIAPDKVSVILNGVDIAAFGAPGGDGSELRHELRLPADATVFGIVARLAPEKDHATLLEAFRLLLRGGADACLVVIGGGPLEGALRSQAERSGLSERVRFLGFRTDIPALLRCLDVFVLSSTMEGISLTLLEAMAASLPIVATDVGGNREVVIEGVTGLLVPDGNPEAMASAMASLHRDPERARALGASGRERAVRVFDIEQMVDAYVALYESLQS